MIMIFIDCVLSLYFKKNQIKNVCIGILLEVKKIGVAVSDYDTSMLLCFSPYSSMIETTD